MKRSFRRAGHSVAQFSKPTWKPLQTEVKTEKGLKVGDCSCFTNHQGVHDLAVSFSGSGMMMIWQLGVAHSLSGNSAFMARVKRVHGTSGGACAGALFLLSREKILAAIEYYSSGKMWMEASLPRDLTHPHEALLKRTVQTLGLFPFKCRSRVGRRFVVHVTPRDWPLRNVCLQDFDHSVDVWDAVAASCCLAPTGHRMKDGRFYLDGGFSDPLPHDATLPTVTVSVFTGEGVDISPFMFKSVSSSDGGSTYVPRGDVDKSFVSSNTSPTPRTFRRFDVSLANLMSLFRGFVPPSKENAMKLFVQGQVDGEGFVSSLERKLQNH
jgi:hypothetical protein